MKALARKLEEIHVAYRKWAGQPFHVSTFRREHERSNGITALDVICFQSADEDALRAEAEFTFLATVGLSLQYPGIDGIPKELVWRIAGRRSVEEIQALAQTLAQISVLPYYHPLRLVPGALISGLALPVFEGMDSLLLTHWGVHSPEYLPATRPPVLLLWVKPLFQSEVSAAAQVGPTEAYHLFRRRGLDWDDPRRPAAIFEEEYGEP